MTLATTVITFILGSACLSLASGEETEVQTKTKCKGDYVVFSESNPAVTAHHIYVYRNGESVASSSVAAEGDLQGRLLVADDTRVTLSNLSSSDLGMYRVEIKLSEENAIRRSVRLVVGEPPVTTSGTLLVKSHFLNDTFLRLKCGIFTSLGYPPVSVIWKDPADQLLASTGFSGQFFTLDLPINAARSGIYCCQLDCREPNYCCLDEQSPLRQCEKVAVQTGRKEKGECGGKEDDVSLVSFMDLALRVSEINVTVRELERARTTQNCSQSCVAHALAPLVQRQAACEQLEAYLERLKAEQKFERDLGDVSKVTMDMKAQLQLASWKIEELRSKMEGSVQQVNKSLNDQVSQTFAEIAGTNQTMQQALFKLKQLDQQMWKSHDQINNLTSRIGQDVDRRRNTSQQVSVLKDSMRDMENALLANVKSLNETFNEHRLQSDKEAMNITAVLQTILSKLQQVDEWMVKENDWRSRASNDLSQITSKWTRTAQDLEDEKTKRDREISAIKTQTTNIENALQIKVNRAEIRDDLVKLKAKRCESGRLSFSPHSQPTVRHGAYPARIHKIHVTFAQPFATPPWVSLGISHLDNYNTANLRINLQALSISTSGFVGQALEWDDTHVVKVDVYWIACNV